MNTMFVIPIFTLIGTIVGAAIPALSEFLISKNNRRTDLKDKHEDFLRMYIIRFFNPAKGFFKLTEQEFRREPFITSLPKKYEEVERFYQKEVMENCPIELLDISANIKGNLSELSTYVPLVEILPDENKARVESVIKTSREELSSDIKTLTKILNKYFF